LIHALRGGLLRLERAACLGQNAIDAMKELVRADFFPLRVS
jgi:hypothetical protein